jgi:histidyl-tRNA synthetase
MQKPSITEGMRDFGPEQVRKRNYIFDTLRSVFVKFGFQPLETPAVENLSTLTGKYGEEGDKLLFKILNNGDFLDKANAEALAERNSTRLTPSISKRGLRYDLTVPFARYVAMNRGKLSFPYKRYQIQPVWRADRPQRGRYREFFQCDVDVIGSESLLYEAELVQIYDEAFAKLNLPVVIKINNRKVLLGIAEAAGIVDRFTDMTVAIDKLDKVGIDGVRKELSERGIAEKGIAIIEKTLSSTSLEDMMQNLSNSQTGIDGLSELAYVFRLLSNSKLINEVKFEPTLARGLSYYTGCIFEVAAKDYQMGSIGGGGRYANLTGVFGEPGLSGVGVSFGADRIYDVLEGLGLFPENLLEGSKILLAAEDESSLEDAFQYATQLRAMDIAVEIYPEPGKMNKIFDYASKRNIPLVSILKKNNEKLIIKDKETGEKATLTLRQVVRRRRILHIEIRKLAKRDENLIGGMVEIRENQKNLLKNKKSSVKGISSSAAPIHTLGQLSKIVEAEKKSRLVRGNTPKKIKLSDSKDRGTPKINEEKAGGKTLTKKTKKKRTL